MIENLYEQCVTDNSGKRATLYSVLFALSILSFIASLLFFAVGVRTTWTMFIFALVFIALGIFLWRKKDEAYSDYEYSFISGQIEVSKIIHNVRRKSLVKFETDSIEVFGKVSSNVFPRYTSMQNAKKIYACFDKSNAYFAFIPGEKGRVLLVFTPDETLLQNMKKYLKVRLEK